MFEWLFEKADEYISESDWKDFAVLKFCLCAIGILIGIFLKPKYKKPVGIVAFLVFIGTYVVLMKKFVGICLRDDEDDIFAE